MFVITLQTTRYFQLFNKSKEVHFMFERYIILAAICFAGIMFICMCQREALEERRSPKRRYESYAGTLLLWSAFTALVCHDYFQPESTNVFDGVIMTVIMTIGFFLMIAHMGFLIAMWRTRDGQPYFSISGVLPRTVYTMMGVTILFGSGLHIASA